MKKFAFIAALYFCIACGLRAETPETIIEQASKKLESYESIADTPFRLAFSIFLDEDRLERALLDPKLKNFDKELLAKWPPDAKCSLRFLSPDKFRFDMFGIRSAQMSFVVVGNRINASESHSAKEIDTMVAMSLKRIVDFIDVRGPKNLLANYRKCKIIDGGDTTVDGIKCRRVDLNEDEKNSVVLFIDRQNKELIKASVSCYIGSERISITFKYASIARPDRENAFVGYPESVIWELGFDKMRIAIDSFTKMDNADESILQIFE